MEMRAARDWGLPPSVYRALSLDDRAEMEEYLFLLDLKEADKQRRIRIEQEKAQAAQKRRAELRKRAPHLAARGARRRR